MTRFAIVPAAGRSRRMGQPKLLLPWRGRTIIECLLDRWCASRVDEILVVVHRDDEQLARVCRRPRVTVLVPDVPPPEMKDSVAAALAHAALPPAASRRPVSAQRSGDDGADHGADVDRCWLLAPADLPELASEVVDRLLAEHAASSPLAPREDSEVAKGFTRPLASQVDSGTADSSVLPLTSRGARGQPARPRGLPAPPILVPTWQGRRGHPVLFPWHLASAVARLGPREGVNALLPRHAVREIPCDDLPPAQDIDTPAEYRRATQGDGITF